MPVSRHHRLLLPGCGSLRAVSRLLRGDVASALALNPIAMLLLPYVLYEFASYGLEAFGRGGLPRLFSSELFARAALMVIMAYWVLRNSPWRPFTLLAH